MKNKGFTLIELLAVIVILGLLAAIIVPSVSDSIDRSKIRTYEVLKGSIVDSAELFISEHAEEYPNIDTPGTTITITLGDLVDEGYFNAPLNDARTDTEIPLTTTITATVVGVGNINIVFNYE